MPDEELAPQLVSTSQLVIDGQFLDRSAFQPACVQYGTVYLDGDPAVPEDPASKGYVDRLVNQVSKVPTGVGMFWPSSRATVPATYGLCDGLWYDPNDTTEGQIGQAATDATHTVQTVNLLNRFLVGAGDVYTVGATGGQLNMPAHTHTGPSHTHSITGPSGGPSATLTHAVSGSTANEDAHTHTVTITLRPNEGGNSSPQTASNTSGGSVSAACVCGAGSAHGHAYGTIAVADHGSHTHTLPSATGTEGTGATGSAGTGATADDNRPPYSGVYWIQKL
jgi:hypothetical protein